MQDVADAGTGGGLVIGFVWHVSTASFSGQFLAYNVHTRAGCEPPVVTVPTNNMPVGRSGVKLAELGARLRGPGAGSVY